ncbi:SPP1 phage holin family protein [Anaerofustis stercorihominis]|uniref:SPP1 phage holin family protein n=1 Tax=Anaerofustis stercorihominis TaxID=214853 RepID=UPI00214ADA64|nr:SPP1 phage holin family protein [Anaerofustis stercorihominis]MCR2033724.1 SPP1 phage holin family protein [Anaerofustis stercorihominis]
MGNFLNWLNKRKGAFLRIIIAGLAFLNAILRGHGYTPLNIPDDLIYDLGSDVLAILTAGYACWKDNNFTEKAIKLHSK